MSADKTKDTEAKKPTEDPEIKSEQIEQIDKKPAVAKAGKRSTKALKETAAKEAKEERKASIKLDVAKVEPKQVKKLSRTRLERAGKKFREVAKHIDKSKTYNLSEAVELAAKTSPVKFDATVELHVNLNVDPRQADQNIRNTVSLPSGTGKTIKVAVLAEADDAVKATKAGADAAGSDNIFAKLDKENIDFDVLIATPAMMQKLSKYARLLGPRGLMPNPKSGTVAADVTTAVAQAKGGKVEFRVDSNGIIHLGIGKVSFGPDKLLPNAEAVMSAIRSAKPSSIKGTYIKSAHLTTSMGPSIKLQV